MASIKLFVVVLVLVSIVFVDARCNKTCRQERRERFLQKFLDGNATTLNQFAHFQQRLARHRERLAKKNQTITMGEQSLAKKIEEIHQKDKDGARNFEGISSINDPIKDMMYQGDILLTGEQADVLFADDDNSNNRTKRQAAIGNGFPRTQWTVGQAIPYTFSSSITNAVRSNIRLALQFWQNNTCLSFAENGAGPNALYFNKGSGCYSYIGRVYQDRQQEVSIGEGCQLFGIIAHEVGHALGFYHTQSRYDRDTYIAVQYQNIPADWRSEFEKETTATNNNYNVEYDYGSVMHYAENNNVGDPVQMLARQPKYQRTMGNVIKPSFDDLLLMNTYYGCINKCTTGVKCQYGGFRNSRNCNTCICPTGFGGADCGQRAGPENGASNCGATLTATSAVQTLTGQVGVNTNAELQRAMGCHWHIVAPPGQFVEIRVQSTSGDCSVGCTFGGTEIKHQGYTLTGTRLCCPSDATTTGTLTTRTNLAVISAYSLYNTQKFTLQYRAVASSNQGPASSSGGGCTDDVNCPTYVANGFCTSTFYTQAQKMEYCPNACNLCQR